MNATPQVPVEELRMKEIFGQAKHPVMELIPQLMAALGKSEKRRASMSIGVKVSGTPEQPAYEITASVPQTAKVRTEKAQGRDINQPDLPGIE
jgi:hypothetical protein